MNNFFEQISAIATVASTPKKTYVPTPAQKFIKNGMNELMLLENNKEKGAWFEKTKDSITIKLRNGNRIIEIAPGKAEIYTADTDAAIKVIQMAIENCKKGGFDSIFAAQKTTRTAKA